jgi:hypothetical protein
MMKGQKRLFRSKYQNPLVYFVVIILFLTVQPFRVKAQDFRWSAPKTIPSYRPDTWPPLLIADRNRTVHAFSYQWIDENESVQAIVYNRWTSEQGWTAPVDILLSPRGDARLTDVFLDKKGFFHLLFFGGDNTFANIYYSTAPAAGAANALMWSRPVIIGKNAGDPAGAVFFEDEQGLIYVIYNGRELGDGLYVINSADGGESWSNATPIFFTTIDKPYINNLKVIRSQSGWAHAVWGVFNESGQGRGIYYSSSKGGDEWSKPVLLASATDGYGTQTPTIVEYKNELFALYNLPGKIKMRRSSDGGITWDDPFNIFPRHVGVNGSLSLVIDSNNDLHLFFGQRISGTPDIHGMWHSIWKNNRWTEPESVVRGPVKVDQEGFSGFDPYEARAVVSQGNVILVTWRTDLASKGNGVWFSYRMIDAPELPSVQLPSPETKTITPPEPTLLDRSFNRTPLPVDDSFLKTPSSPINVGSAILVMLVVVILFIMTVLIISKR